MHIYVFYYNKIAAFYYIEFSILILDYYLNIQLVRKIINKLCRSVTPLFVNFVACVWDLYFVHQFVNNYPLIGIFNYITCFDVCGYL